MNWAIKGCFRLGFGVCVAFSWAAGADESIPKISVHVYNYAKLSAEVLARSEYEAARIFELTGLRMEWIDCPLTPGEASLYPDCALPPGGTRLALRLVSRSMAEALGRASDCSGVAYLPEDGSFGWLAAVFPFKARELSRQGPTFLTFAIMLGHFIAHELGHLLLGAGSHTRSGIMRGHWDGRDLKQIVWRMMSFNAQQTKAIREQVRKRSATQHLISGSARRGSILRPGS